MADYTAPEPYAPHPGSILAGGGSVTNSTTSTAFLTIPAGRMWVGSISVVAQSANGSAGGQEGYSRIVTAGTDVVPAAGTTLAIATSRRDLSGSESAHPKVYVKAPADNAVTLNIVNSTATTHAWFASANGVLL